MTLGWPDIGKKQIRGEMTITSDAIEELLGKDPASM
jgi:hypothetical protein